MGKAIFKILMGVLTMSMLSFALASCGGSEDDSPENPSNEGMYEGQSFVGSWEGSDGSDSFYIELKADGSYTDYLVHGSDKTAKCTGSYSVSGNRITLPSDCNVVNCWTDKPYTIKMSGKNKMIWTNSLMDNYGQELVLTRQ